MKKPPLSNDYLEKRAAENQDIVELGQKTKPTSQEIIDASHQSGFEKACPNLAKGMKKIQSGARKIIDETMNGLGFLVSPSEKSKTNPES